MTDPERLSAQAVRLLAVALMVYEADREYADQLIAFASRLLEEAGLARAGESLTYIK